jgi:phage terminase small subunit
MAKSKLTDKQSLFCQEYLVDLNATQAAIRAGYSKKTAKTIAGQNLSKLIIQEKITELKNKRSEKTEVDAAYVIKRLTQIDEMDILDILTDSGDMKPIKDWPLCWRRTISGIDISTMFNPDTDTETILKKIKWPDKLKNIELLGKHVDVSAFKEQIEHSGTIKLDDITDEDLDAEIKNLAKN